MIQQVNFYQFYDAFTSSNTYKDNFSYDGLRALFEYLEELEEDAGQPLEFDMVALCCEYSEYDSFEEIQKQYNNLESLDDLRDETTVIEFDGGIIIQDY